MDINQLLVAILAFVAVGGLGVAFLEPLLSGANRAEKRQAALVDPRARRKAVEEAGNRRKQIADTLKELEQRQKAQKLTFEQRCEQAGVEWTKKTFILISIGCAIGLGLVVLLITKQPILAAGAMFVGGFGLPRWMLTRMAKKRQKLFMEEFPNAIDAIVRGIRSGLPLNDCLRLIALEAKEPLKGEFRGVVEAQAMGVSIADGIMKIFERIPLAEVNFFGIVIQIQAKSGGNLGEILSNLSRVIRDRKKLREKVDAMSTEAKASASIIGALPFLVGFLVYMGNPAYIELLWTTKAGQIGLGACFVIMGFGIMVMKKMINFDI
ncbi:type II secretion system F family protein [Rhabdaerophilum sp. SD176]|uniref:type II secretion system F family protein n=1 Tax=Rhabdaerophilum sp. SD176 TaxID=2983548 RepID=UPI0024DFB4B1|nr:type II secretion system F family protein [Rhabdaerophilum sp. SD176]